MPSPPASNKDAVIIAGIISQMIGERGGYLEQEHANPLANRIVSAGFTFAETPTDVGQDGRIARLEREVAEIRGWMGPLGRLP